MEKVLHVDFCMYLCDLQYVFSKCCSYFFQHFSWEFLMIGILLSALLSKCPDTVDMSLPANRMKYFYFCLLVSVYAIHQSMTYYKLMIIFRHHFIDLIYGNCFVCMLNNAWHIQLKF